MEFHSKELDFVQHIAPKIIYEAMQLEKVKHSFEQKVSREEGYEIFMKDILPKIKDDIS